MGNRKRLTWPILVVTNRSPLTVCWTQSSTVCRKLWIMMTSAVKRATAVISAPTEMEVRVRLSRR